MCLRHGLVMAWYGYPKKDRDTSSTYFVLIDHIVSIYDFNLPYQYKILICIPDSNHDSSKIDRDSYEASIVMIEILKLKISQGRLH